MRRYDEAIALLRRCVQLDPLSVQAHRSLTGTLVRTGDLAGAEVAARKLVELAPESGITHAWLGLVQMLQGRHAEALATYERESHATFRLMGFAMAHHARGDAEKSDRALRELIATNAAGAAFQIAEVYGYRGEVDAAFEWLERAYGQRDPGLGMTISSPFLRTLHGHAQWRPFVRKMGLPDDVTSSAA
jgi:tetratricopeptide (TPR) repeat protein